ncbi:MAG: hypothetical protein JO016_10850 [Actinobacteria bacterium]|nr:hypothetical protein [Actinomycetota bacterium]
MTAARRATSTDLLVIGAEFARLMASAFPFAAPELLSELTAAKDYQHIT